MTRFGTLVCRIDERGRGVNLPLMSVSQTLGVVRRSELTDDPPRAESLDDYKVCRPGDIVFNKMSIRDGAMGVAREGGLVTYHYEVMRPRSGADPRYVVYLMKSGWFTGELIQRERGIGAGGTSGVRTTEVPFSVLRTIDAPVPESTAQRAIADYLDAETARIDALVAARRRMMGLLEERWNGELDLEVSGDWATRAILANEAAAVPEGWRVEKLVRLLDPSTPLSYGILLPGPRLDDGVPYIGAGDVKAGRLDLADLPRTTPDIAAAYPRTRMRAGELVYAIRGSFGSVAQIPAELDGVNLSRDAARIVPGPSVHGRWLLHALRSHIAQEQFARREVGVAVTGINVGDLKQIRLPVPALPAQQVIAETLDRRSALYREAVDDVERQVNALMERRLALITAAVTGQIEIPGVAA